MQHQGTVSILIFSSIAWLLMKNVLPVYLLSRETWSFLFSAKFVDQSDSFIIYQLKCFISIFTCFIVDMDYLLNLLKLKFQLVFFAGWEQGHIGSNSHFSEKKQKIPKEFFIMIKICFSLTLYFYPSSDIQNFGKTFHLMVNIFVIDNFNSHVSRNFRMNLFSIIFSMCFYCSQKSKMVILNQNL